MNHTPKLGMVLSGGGARGAYQVGVARYMAEQGIMPDVFAGASIGALNGAMLAASRDMNEGAARLERVWRSLSFGQVIRVDYSTVGLALLWGAARTALSVVPASAAIMEAVEEIAALRGDAAFMKRLKQSPFEQIIAEGLLGPRRRGLLDSAPLREILDAGVGMESLLNGRPLWVSVYPSRGHWADAVRSLLGALWVSDTPDSTFLHIQSLSAEEQMRALLASAAVPLLYESHEIGDDLYSDGSQGGWKRSQGNTPITPLVQAGCTCCIVTHLSDGSLWDRTEFPETTIIEVRPQHPIHPDGALLTLMNFSPDRIDGWISQGYADAKRCIGEALTAVRLVHAGRSAQDHLRRSIEELENDGLDEVMKALE